MFGRFRIAAWSLGLLAILRFGTGLLAVEHGFAMLVGGAIVFGLLVEAAIQVEKLRRAMVKGRPGAAPAGDARPADGVVEIATMAMVRGEPNRADPRFRRFVALEPGGGFRAGTSRRPGREPLPMRGRIVLIAVFEGRFGRAWSDEEIAEVMAALDRAGRWVEREAIRWRAPVNVALTDAYFVAEEPPRGEVEVAFLPQGDEIEPFEAGATTKILIAASRAAARLGFRDVVDWMERIDPRIEADARVWLWFPRCAGRSFAVPLDLTELAGVSLAVCYARDADFPEPLAKPPAVRAVTVAHELLHLFGALDKYNLPFDVFPARSVSALDIMLLNESALARLRVDRRTAAEIGWLDAP